MVVFSPDEGHAAEADAMEVELAESIVVAVEGAYGLPVRVGIADGKFAAYVAAVLGTGQEPKRRPGANARS